LLPYPTTPSPAAFCLLPYATTHLRPAYRYRNLATPPLSLTMYNTYRNPLRLSLSSITRNDTRSGATNLERVLSFAFMTTVRFTYLAELP